MPRFIDLTGKRFGSLVVLSKAPDTSKDVRWVCKCDCGSKTTVLAYRLKNEGTTSCGCIKAEATRVGQSRRRRDAFGGFNRDDV